MNIKRSLYFRARAFVEKEEKKAIGTQAGLSNPQLYPLDLLQALETLSLYVKKANCLLDIGAHKGLFAKAAHEFLPLEQIFCFEPNSALHAEIKEGFADVDLTVSDIALSDKDGEAVYYEHQNDVMNSLVEAEEGILSKEFPWDDPEKMNQRTVKTNTLDTFLEERDALNGPFILKIDTQGNELKILKSARKTMEKTEVCLVEHMFFTPYKTEYSFGELISFMEAEGFECKGPVGFIKRPSKKISGADFLFSKK